MQFLTSFIFDKYTIDTTDICISNVQQNISILLLTLKTLYKAVFTPAILNKNMICLNVFLN